MQQQCCIRGNVLKKKNNWVYYNVPYATTIRKKILVLPRIDKPRIYTRAPIITPILNPRVGPFFCTHDTTHTHTHARTTQVTRKHKKKLLGIRCLTRLDIPCVVCTLSHSQSLLTSTISLYTLSRRFFFSLLARFLSTTPVDPVHHSSHPHDGEPWPSSRRLYSLLSFTNSLFFLPFFFPRFFRKLDF